MLYTVTVVVQDKADTSYLEQVYLIEAESEEDASRRVRAKIDPLHFHFVWPDDIRPLLFEDSSDSLFCKHFENIEAYKDVWKDA